MKNLIIVILLYAWPCYLKAQVYIPQNNLIVNGDFMSRDPEQRPLGWVNGKGLQTSTISGEERRSARQDDQSLKLADTSATMAVFIRTQKIAAQPGSEYIATAWVKTKSGVPGNFNLEFWDQNNALIGSKSAIAQNNINWKELSISSKAPDKCTHVTVSIGTKNQDIGISYWDDVTLVNEEIYQPEIKNGVRELFMDDYRIQEMVDIQRVVNKVKKSKVLLHPTEPWEGNSSYIYGTVLQNEPIGTGYRMWYCSYLKEKYYLCYATSKDGLNWHKPKLGIFDFNGSKENNICREGGGTLVYDPLDINPARRYKLMAFDHAKEFYGYNVYFSADGLTWNHDHKKPVLPYGDVSNVAYDKEKARFIAITKQRMVLSNTSVTSGKNDRAAFVSVSSDFINWTAPEQPNSLWALAVEGDNHDDMLVRSRGGIEANIYGMPIYPYQNLYIGFPWMFDINTYGTGEFAVTGDGKIQPQVAVSRDLRHWSRPVREAVIPLGKSGAWDDGTLYTSSTMQVSDREMRVYYGAMNLPHGGSTKTQTQYARIAMASWRRDGIISLYNEGNDVGTITTKKLLFNGKLLKTNVKLKPGGNLKVEILDKDNQVINGYAFATAKPIKNDQYAATVKWDNGADLGKLKGKEIKLRFYLSGGELYSYWFE